MADDATYDEAAARREEAVYRTDEARRRRAFVRDRLDPASDDDVLSVGCGPGFEPAELAATVGSSGSVVGVDASPAMLALARERCGDRVDLLRGDATALPLATDAVDAATLVQVLEYVPDPGAALADLARVLRPGGRAVVLDTDWRTFVWRADDDERSRAVLDAWEERVPHPRIGSDLAPPLREAGFAVERVDPYAITGRSLDGTFFGRNLPFVVDHAAEALGEDVAEAWREDVEARDERGETFVSLTQYCYVVTAE